MQKVLTILSVICAVALPTSCGSTGRRGVAVTQCISDPSAKILTCENRYETYELAWSETEGFVCYHGKEHEQLLDILKGRILK